MNYQNDLQAFLKEFQVIGTTSIICNKEQILHEAYLGYQDKENSIITSNKTIYRIASISKVVVALGVMKLVEEGKIDINQDIAEYLGYPVRNPHFPDCKITIKMLMTQTSSLYDAGDGEKGYYGSKAGYIDIPLCDLLNDNGSKYYAKDVWSNNMPGTVWDYCNFGCGILACIIEKVSGELFGEYIKKILLSPLKINSGFKLYDINNVENLAVHYLYNESTQDFDKYRDYETFLKYQSKIFNLGDNYTGVAGGLYISGCDLTKIMLMLMNNGIYKGLRLFKEETIKEMKKIHWSGISNDNAYTKKGLQLINLDISESNYLGHFGNACGLRSFMLFNDNFGMIFIANGGNYLGDENHLTPLLEKVINFMSNYCK